VNQAERRQEMARELSTNISCRSVD